MGLFSWLSGKKEGGGPSKKPPTRVSQKGRAIQLKAIFVVKFSNNPASEPCPREEAEGAFAELLVKATQDVPNFEVISQIKSLMGPGGELPCPLVESTADRFPAVFGTEVIKQICPESSGAVYYQIQNKRGKYTIVVIYSGS